MNKVSLTLDNLERSLPRYVRGQELNLKYIHKIKQVNKYFQTKFDEVMNGPKQPKWFYITLLEYRCSLKFFINDVILQFKFNKTSIKTLCDDYVYCRNSWIVLRNSLKDLICN